MKVDKSVAAAAACVFQCPQHRIQVERGRLLTRRELPEVLDLPGYDRLHSVDDIGVAHHPVPVVVRVLVGPFKRVAAQVEYLWNPQAEEWLGPTQHPLR